MSMISNILWLNVSPSLRQFDQPLLHFISQKVAISEWQYLQTVDEPLSLEVALQLLDDYCQKCPGPVHLLGHSTSGLLALLYAQRYPEKVKSLTLLSVGVYAAVDWQAHYYAQFNLLPCLRETILAQSVQNLFGDCCPPMKRKYLSILDQDLRTSLSPHNLYQQMRLFPKGVSVPFLVCGGQNDFVIDQNLLQGWQTYLKKGDRLWECPKGRYFFHYVYPQLVSEQIFDFWHSLGFMPNFSPKLEPANLIKNEMN